eukprot:15606448-Heterocapsa_arctica.AAC.1
MALSGSNDEDDEAIAGGQETSIVHDFPSGAPGAAEEEEGDPELYVRGSCTRFIGDVRGSGGAESCRSFLAVDSV